MSINTSININPSESAANIPEPVDADIDLRIEIRDHTQNHSGKKRRADAPLERGRDLRPRIAQMSKVIPEVGGTYFIRQKGVENPNFYPAKVLAVSPQGQGGNIQFRDILDTPANGKIRSVKGCTISTDLNNVEILPVVLSSTTVSIERLWTTGEERYTRQISLAPIPDPEAHLYQPYSAISQNDPLAELIRDVYCDACAETDPRKQCPSLEHLKQSIPYFDQSRQEYECALQAHKLPFGLVVQKIDDIIGNGVFLSPDARPIPPNTLIGFYPGKPICYPSKRWNKSPYLWVVFEKLQERYRKRYREIAQQYNANLSEKEKASQGIPPLSNNDILCLDLDCLHVKNYTATFNHSKQAANAEGKIFFDEKKNAQVLFVTTQKVKPGHEILINYGEKYLEALGVPPVSLTPSTYLLKKIDGIFTVVN